MPFEVCQTRAATIKVDDASTEFVTRTKMSATLNYRVVATGYDNPASVSDVDAAQASGVPMVNGTTFFDSINNSTRPFMICTSKSSERDQQNAFIFNVSVEFEEVIDGRESPGGEPPEDLTDISPKISGYITKTERVMWKDLDEVQCTKMPGVDQFYEIPVTQDVAQLKLVIEQYMPYIQFEQMHDWSYKCNSDYYRSKGPGRWKTGAVAAKEVEVELASGPFNAVLVTIPVYLSDYSVTNVVSQGGTGSNMQQSGGRFFVGHQTALPLVSRMVKRAGDSKIVPYTKETMGYASVSFNDINGFSLNDQDDGPHYVKYKTTPEISYGFLQI